MADRPKETFGRECIICPYCGFEHRRDLSEIAPDNDDRSEVDCHACEQTFDVSVHTTTFYSAFARGSVSNG